MSQTRVLIALAVSATLLCPEFASAASNSSRGVKTPTAKAYRWTDNNGVVHFGDSVPPEYAAQGRAELNEQGVALREFPRQLSPAEEAEAQKSAAEVARRRQHDAFLMNTYTQVRDIEQLRDERLTLIDGQMEIARGSVGITNQRITHLEERMRNFLPYSSAPGARRLPDQLVEDAVRTLKERNGLQATLASREQEKKDLRAEFDADITRFQELTAIPKR